MAPIAIGNDQLVHYLESLDAKIDPQAGDVVMALPTFFFSFETLEVIWH